MQAISQNGITQGQHGASKAVDYGASPDSTIYAPEDGTITSYGQQGVPGTTNDAGLALRMRGATGLHQFAHTEKTYVSVGQVVKRGQPLAKMGYTGYTIPAGPGGTHCHWWIDTGGGAYVYPPSRINETFIKLGDTVSDSSISEAETDVLRIGHSEAGGWNLDEVHAGKYDKLFVDTYRGQSVSSFIRRQWQDGGKWRDKRIAALNYFAQKTQNDNLLKATQDQVATLNKTNTEKDKTIQDLQAKLAVQSEDTQLLNGFGEWLTKIIARLGFKKG